MTNGINVAEVGAFDREERKGIGVEEVAERGVVGKAHTRALEDCFLLSPQAGEGHVGTGSLTDQSELVVAHRITGDLLIVGFYRLDIDTDGTVIGDTDDGLIAMTEVEMHLGMIHEAGLAVRAVVEHRLPADAIGFAQGLAQQQVGRRALTLLMLVTFLEAKR